MSMLLNCRYCSIVNIAQLSILLSILLQNWEANNEISDYAVSYCGSKAFIHWSNRGKESKTGKENNLKGMSLLIFGDKDKASRVLSFRQPLASERPHVMKEE